MNPKNLFSATGASLALACGLGLFLGAGCASPDAGMPGDDPGYGPGSEEDAANASIIRVRFNDNDPSQSPDALAGNSMLPGASPAAAPGALAPSVTPSVAALAAPLIAPIERTDVTRILVDVTYADTGLPFVLRFALDSLGDGGWEGILPLLPRDQPLRFAAEAFDAEDVVIFSGETLVTLTIDNPDVEIPLVPAQDQQEFDMPRMYRIVYPGQIVAGQEVQIIFTLRGNPGETIDYTILGDNGLGADARFSPAQGSVTLTNTVADFVTLFTAPEVDEQTALSYQVVISSADSLSSVAIATNFVTTIVPRAEGIDVVDGVLPTVRFNPVVVSLEASGTAIADAVELTADVSDDTPAQDLIYRWSYAPNSGTPEASFANDGAGNPAIFEGYTLDHQGTITLEVTDADGGTTTLYYQLVPNQFAHAIDHDAVSGVTRIVAGDAHTCVLTGEGKVRCWGDAQLGQIGYGNAQDIGDALDRLPYTAGDVPLPEIALQLVAGDNHTCALLRSGLILCWGNNDHGQLGYGTTEHVGDGEPVTSFGYVTLGGPATRIAAGGDHTCALLEASGALRCWGRNDFGQLGHGHTEDIGDDENVFDRGNVDVGATVVDMALGDDHTCVLLAGGNMRCWGRNNNGQLGYGDNVQRGHTGSLADLADIELPGAVRKIAAGSAHTCVHLQSGAMRCWGHGTDGRLGYGFQPQGNPNRGDQAGERPIDLDDIALGAAATDIVTDIAVGDAHSCALLSNGRLTCWGQGQAGRLGDGTADSHGTPPAAGVDLAGTSAYHIAAGAAHTCALRSNGTARCWGEGASGRLGRGGIGDVYSPAATADIAIFGPLPMTFARSCNEIRATATYTSNGAYFLDLDGSGGSAPIEAYCEMFADGGGWTLIATVADDNSNYWTWNNRAVLYNGNVHGSITDVLDYDYQSPAWAQLTGSAVLVEANGSRFKYARYDSIIQNQPLASRYPGGLQVVGTFFADRIAGSWFQECGNGLGMRLMTPDSDGNGWGTGGAGFVWMSVNNNSCQWDDAAGGINTADSPNAEHWTSSSFQFYRQNFATALNVFVR